MHTRSIIREYSHRPRKSMAQHFLVDENVLNRISQLAHLTQSDTVVEIGAGPGNLTRRLVRLAGKVYAIEKDEELCLILSAELKSPNMEVINADALEMDYRSLAPASGRMKVVANLPYNVTTPLLFKLLETPEIFSDMLLLVQAEVAERIAADPGTRDFGILSVFTQLWAEARVVAEVKPRSFYPRPRVDSALLRLRMLQGPAAQIDNPEYFRRMVRAAFGKRRKTIKNSLAKSAELALPAGLIVSALEKLGIDHNLRPEDLTIGQFAELANEFCRNAKGTETESAQ